MANGNKFWTLEIWLHGLVGAFIGGAAGAVSSGFGSMIVDPEHFNLSAGLGHTMELMGTVAFINGIITAAAYLKQSPVPPLSTTTTVERISATAVDGQPTAVQASTVTTTTASTEAPKA
jgi:hypothetical protein